MPASLPLPPAEPGATPTARPLAALPLLDARRTAAQAAPASAKPAAPAPAAARLLELWSAALEHHDFDAGAHAVLATLARQFASRRVSLAWRPRDGAEAARLVAVSSGAEIDPARRVSRELAAAADEALDAGETLLRPGVTPAGIATRAHDALLQGGHGVQAVLSVPIEGDLEQRGVLLFEQPSALDAEARQQAADAALFVGPLLLLKARAERRRPLAQTVRRALAASASDDPDVALLPDHLRPAHLRRRRQVRLALATAASLALLAVLVPQDAHIRAPLRVEGAGQRTLAAPADGFLAEVLVRPGARVRRGELLATLESREATAEAQRLAAERAQHEQALADALTREDGAATAQAQAKYAQTQAQWAAADARLQQARILAPFDGVVIGGDLTGTVGRPLQRGEALMVVAPGIGWRLVAEVDEQDLPRLAVGQAAEGQLAGRGRDPVTMRLTRVAPTAQLIDGRNVVEAEALLPPDTPGLQAGMRGLVRIETGRRPPLAVWLERARHALQKLQWVIAA